MQHVVQHRSLSVTTVAVYLAVSQDVTVFLTVQMAVTNKDAVGGGVLTCIHTCCGVHSLI